MTAAEEPVEAEVVITEPGVYDIRNDEYHADPVPGGSLSSTGARKLLPPSCPALFKWEQDHPRPYKKAFDFGHAAHEMVLGGGPEIVRVDRETWNTNAVKAEVAEIRLRGAVPLKPSEYEQVHAMADAIRRHPVAGKLLSPENGKPEAALFWKDDEFGIQRRARLDLLPTSRNGRMILPDYKSSASALPDKFARAAMDFGYHCQADYYSEAVRALGLAEDVAFVFVVQEKVAPYLISVVQLDVTAMRIGALLNRRAMTTYVECTRTGVWPGYVSDVELVSLPFWYERAYEEELS